ncbi:alpha-(1-_3)-arabinofuranosyltransferase domain-containing protein [Kribbia dieselivorans]|uniref:alpha-(1->3)-arabinofuranosyltransferase domain-containing protein n=1 Tax=Kribbia dieselivorans TaxID=331526 RepID=UPI000839A69E|nr:alpha-(1->3)-arabinofuranosyltransferase family protein [Kribbia dieselivorans]
MIDSRAARISAESDERTLWMIRLVAGVLFLAAIAFRQGGDRIVPDTKLDLTANPGGFLQRALSMWDPLGQLGQLQNQAYGYLLPAGPFHLLLTGVGLPEWVVQRLWWTVVMGVAFIGMWRLAGALGVGTAWTRYAAALMFAASPRMLSEVAITSVEVWPYAMAPWVLLPLVDPQPRTRLWRVSHSALAVALTGGVNAVATGAVLVLPTLWYATRADRRRALLDGAVWLGAVIAVSLWWLVPLVLLGRYSPPFLDWIENAPITTHFSSPFEALRGTTHWLGHLAIGGPVWPAGWQYSTQPLLVGTTALLALLGLLGIRLAARQVRSFLILGLLVGLALVTLGYTGSASSPMAGPMQAALDGALAALRNTHKFELVVRIPLTLGLAAALAALVRAGARLRVEVWAVPAAFVALCLAVVTPGLTGSLTRSGDAYTAIPQYWYDAATWLDTEAAPGTVLIVPAAGFAEFGWGTTRDEPLQALSTREFAVRDAVPLGSAGATRVLDDIEDRLRHGDGSGLRAQLRSVGIRWVIVRNDLTSSHPGVVGLSVHQALDQAGLSLARAFGDPIDTPGETQSTTVDERTRLPYPAVQAYDVGDVPQARVVPLDRVAQVAGGPEDVTDALAATPGTEAAVVGEDARALRDATGVAAPLVVTDGNQRREVDFGRTFDNRSPVLFADDPGRSGRRVTSYDAGTGGGETVRVGLGDLLELRVSSSAADAGSLLHLGPGFGPQALLDGNGTTAWVSGNFAPPAGEWAEVRFRRPREVPQLLLRLRIADGGGAPVNRVEIATDAGVLTTPIDPSTMVQAVAVPKGATARIRITALGSVDGKGYGFGIRELAIPGLDLRTALSVPALTADDTPAESIVLRSSGRGASGCTLVDTRPLCSPLLASPAESEGGIYRQLSGVGSFTGEMSGTVLPRPGRMIERILDGTGTAEVWASSRNVGAPAARPGAVADNDLGTGWVAGRSDTEPRLRVTWPRAVRTHGVRLMSDQYLAASRPRYVQYSLDGRAPITTRLRADSTIRWKAQKVRRLTLTFVEQEPMWSVDNASGVRTQLPVGLSELRPLGVTLPAPPTKFTDATGARCGFGPEIVINGQSYPTRVDGTVQDVADGVPLRWRTCGEGTVRLPSASVSIEARNTAEFAPASLTFRRAGDAPTERDADGITRDVRVERPSATTLRAQVPTMSSQAVFVVAQNHSAGWQARTADGTSLTPIRVNGWQQGWVLPAGTHGEITASFTPNRLYVAGLVLGALAVIACVGLVCWVRTRPGGDRPDAAAQLPPLAAGVTPVVALSLIAGWLGLLGGVIALAAAFLPGVRSASRRVIVGGLIGLGAALLATSHAAPGWQPEASPWLQALLLTAIAFVVVSPRSDDPNA